jgi:Xaa-Pro dipeptidase
VARQRRLIEAINAANLDAVVLNPGPTLTYLTGLHFHLSERPVLAVFGPDLPCSVVLPELEMGKMGDLPYAVSVVPYGEDPGSWGLAFREALDPWPADGIYGVEPTHFRVLELRYAESAIPEARFVEADRTLGEIRVIKEESELAAIRKAVDIAQRGMKATLPRVEIGMTERELAAELTLHLIRNGSETPLPFEPIVASGPNSANPHATRTDRVLQTGDLLLIDWGASHRGYLSDLTRTFALGEVDSTLREVAEIVGEANQKAREIAGPGVTAGDVDRAAREWIERAGYGTAFKHRTGHGFGLEVHEPPYIREGSGTWLRPGMTFTVEPGIYLDGRGGVRVEDDFLITSEGGESLSDLPRELIRIG